MRVKIGNKMSLDHNAVLEVIDSKIGGSTSVQRYVDDATLLEDVVKDQPRIVNHDNKSQLIRAKKTETAFNSINKACEKKKLKVNKVKTKILAVSNSKYHTSTWIKTPDGEVVTSGKELKLLRRVS